MEVQKGAFQEESSLSTGVCALPCSLAPKFVGCQWHGFRQQLSFSPALSRQLLLELGAERGILPRAGPRNPGLQPPNLVQLGVGSPQKWDAFFPGSACWWYPQKGFRGFPVCFRGVGLVAF